MVWKMGIRKKQKAQTLQAIGTKILLPVFLALFRLLVCLFVGLRETRNLASQYVQDTAELYVEQINKDILQMNTELIQILVNNDAIARLPGEIGARDAKYYQLLEKIRDENRLLKIRYQEVQNFFVYAQEPDLLVGDSGVVFRESKVSGLMNELREFSREAVKRSNPTTEWSFLEADESVYIIGWYAKDQKMMGCVIQLNEVFSMLQEMTEKYQVNPYMRQKDGKVVFPENTDAAAAKEQGEEYEYQLGTLGKLGVCILQDGGIFEDVLQMQMILILLITVLMVICAIQLIRYYRSLMRPLQSFVQGITEMEEEQQLNENGENNILELEAVSDRFRGMIRKIQSLKIAIYEKELNEQKAELEYMQEQIRPHFFLNCLSLIHGIADAQGEKKITYITRVLSEYMRYNYQDSGKERNIQEELEHVKKYVELQKLRYGEDGFRFEVIEDAQVGECRVPSLVLQTLVENAIVHAVTLDRMVEISLYITTEVYEDGRYLYICVSDTGKGFSGEILEAIEKDLPIIYNGRKHVGLQNIRRRLLLLYGGRATMTIQNMDENYGAIVELRIPQDGENF